MADPSMALPPEKTCGDCAHHRRCSWLIQCPPSSTACDWAPSRFLPRPEEPATPAAGYVSPLDPPPGDPRAAHVIIPGTRECAPSCPCWVQRGKSRLRIAPAPRPRGAGGEESAK